MSSHHLSLPKNDSFLLDPRVPHQNSHGCEETNVSLADPLSTQKVDQHYGICVDGFLATIQTYQMEFDVHNVPVPYYHDDVSFTHNFIVILTEADVTSGFLTMNYGNIASKVLSKDVRLVDERGLEWNCPVQNISHRYNHVKIGGEWAAMVRARGYGGGTHVMFGSPRLGNALELFVKKHY
ncbi:hypothetical protein QL285_058515 [Trifolium repens]|nr:hypothetical protein QL285_058515 [Trifolium repens]